MKQRILGAAAVVIALTAGSGHIGSPDAWADGFAGPYHVVVNVRPPSVVPGIADVYVRVADAAVRTVAVQENFFATAQNAPPPEPAEQVGGDASLYHVGVWVMQSGSNSVNVVVDGARGSGKFIVPIGVVATRRLQFDRPLAFLLCAVGIVLFIGIASIFGAAVREGVLPPGEQPDSRRRSKARTATGLAALATAVLLFGGWKWWNAEDAAFMRSIYRPWTASASVLRSAQPTLDFRITDSSWIHRNDGAPRDRPTPIIPDHGKLMHLFMVRDGDMSAFAHLHPVTVDSLLFRAALPPVPAGGYRVFADITRESGFSSTLVAHVVVPAFSVGSAPAAADSDDSWTVSAPASAVATSVPIGDGRTMRWNRGTAPIVAGVPAPLSFSVLDATGTVVRIDPYMGMKGHAVVMRDDGTVFIHLHPNGTPSMAAQQAFELRGRGDSIPGTLAGRIQSVEKTAMPGMTTGSVSGEVSFPYAFPRKGRYRVWVQVRRGNQVLSGVFDAVVIG